MCVCGRLPILCPSDAYADNGRDAAGQGSGIGDFGTRSVLALISRGALENSRAGKFRVDLCRQVCYHVAHERDNNLKATGLCLEAL